MIETAGEMAAECVSIENVLLAMPDPQDWSEFDQRVSDLDVLIARLKALRAAAAGLN
jgi:hypothetical protein